MISRIVRLLIMITLFLGATVSVSGPQLSSSAAAAGLSHPYLLFDTQDLSRLINEANDPSHERRAIYQAILAEVDANGASTAPAGGLPSYALAYLISGKNSYGEAVRLGLLALASQDEWNGGLRDRKVAVKLTYYAVAFDLAHSYLQGRSGFQTIRDKLARETFKMYEAASGGYNSTWQNWWRTSYSQNHFYRDVGSMVMGALALKYEGDYLSEFSQADVNSWIEFGKTLFGKSQSALNGIVDGSWYEGNMYEETTIGSDLPHALYALRRLEGYDLISDNPWMQAIPRFWIYNMVPDEPARSRLTQYGDGGSTWWRKNGILSTLRLLARINRDTYAQWAADRIVGTNGRDTRFSGMNYALSIVYEFFYYDESVASSSPRNDWPESWLAEDLGLAFMHSSWDEGGIHAALKTGAYGGRTLFDLAQANYEWDAQSAKWTSANYSLGGSQGMYPQDIYTSTAHAHPDNNGIYIYANGVYLAPEAPGSGNMGGTGISKDPWARLTSSHNTIVVDGRGQVGEGKIHPTSGNDREDYFQSDGSIQVFAPTSNFDFTLGDATRSYPRSLGLTEFQRHFFFLKPDYFVVFDTLNADSPKTYDWFIHVTDGANFEGRWVQGLADDGNVLGINVVSPQSYQTDTGVRSNKNTNRFIDRNDEELHFIQLRANNAREMRFITVLLPTTLGAWGERPTIEKISESSRAAGVRVTHSDGAVDVILSGYHTDSPETIGNYLLDGLGGVIRKTADGGLLSIYVVNGTTLKEDGRLFLQLSEQADAFEATYLGSEVAVVGEGIGSFTIYAPDATRLIINGQNVSFGRQGDFISYAGGASLPVFQDVPFDHPFHSEIEALYQAGYTAGCQSEPLLFCPEQAMTRAESAVFVQRGVHGAENIPPAPTSQIFEDLPMDNWATKWASLLYTEGYTAGCGEAPLVYCPWQGHTRTEGTVFYLRMLNGPDFIPPAPAGLFADVTLDFWGADWIEAAYETGLILACGENPLRFCPDDPLTRALAAYMMVQAKGLP